LGVLSREKSGCLPSDNPYYLLDRYLRIFVDFGQPTETNCSEPGPLPDVPF
jgi:hypothetical protein